MTFICWNMIGHIFLLFRYWRMLKSQRLWSERPLSELPRKLHMCMPRRILRKPIRWLCGCRRMRSTKRLRTWCPLFQRDWRTTVHLSSRLRRRSLHYRLRRYRRMFKVEPLWKRCPLFQPGRNLQVLLSTRIHWGSANRMYRYFWTREFLQVVHIVDNFPRNRKAETDFLVQECYLIVVVSLVTTVEVEE